jgi:rfaE bifunctional protein kinase chain/domain
MNIKSKISVNKLFSEFEKTSVLVIGDIMVDSYVMGHVERISPEAPVPVVAVDKREDRMGGAANVAMNIKALGAKPLICAVIGNDAKGQDFLNLLKNQSITNQGIVVSDSRRTTTKFRILGNHTQMLRVDEEDTGPLQEKDKKQMMERIASFIENKQADAIVFQDYDKGVIDRELISFTVSLARKYQIPVAVDPKKLNFHDYKEVTLFKPNLKELKEGTQQVFSGYNQQALTAATALLQQKLHAAMLMVTLSEYGVYIRYRNNADYHEKHIAAHKRKISDVSGAGDTVISVATLCLAIGISPEDMAVISNLAGGLVCEEVGVVPVDKEKLQQEIIRIFGF